MQRKWKELWIKALESGRFEQGQSTPRNRENQYCCLGVLCKVLDEHEFPHLRWDEIPPSSSLNYTGRVTYHAEYETSELPPLLLHDLHITQAEQGTLMHMNDHGETFKQIAKHIREKL